MNELEELLKGMGSEEPTNNISAKEIFETIKKYWAVLWNKKWSIVAAGLLGGIIGYIYAYNRPITYSSHYTFTVGGSSSSGGALGGLSSLLNLGGGGMDAFTGDNVLELLKSPALMEKTLLSPVAYEGDTLSFMEYLLTCDSTRANCQKEKTKKETKNGVVSACDIFYPLEQERMSFSREQDSLLNLKAQSLIKNSVAVSRRDKKLSFMEYTFAFPDEQFAKRFSEAHLKAVSEFYVNTKTALARKNVESFLSKADSVRKCLDQSFAKRAAYSDANRNANGMYAAPTLWKIETDIQILSATYTEMMKNIEMLKMDLAKETPLIQIIDEPRYPLPNDKMRKLKGVVAGGFLAGFLSCLAILAWNIIPELRRKLEEEENEPEVAASPNE